MNIKAYENIDSIVSVNKHFFDAISLYGAWSDETRKDVINHNINWLKR